MVLIRAGEIDEQAHTLQPHTTAVKAQLDDVVAGEVGKGAQRWLNIGVRFQPSEVMKLAVPAALAWLLHERPLPPSLSLVLAMLAIIMAPVAMIGLQPDLGTAILISLSGATVIFLAGINARYILSTLAIVMASMPMLWYSMLDYQKQRVVTFPFFTG